MQGDGHMSLDFYESEMEEYLNSPEWLNRRRLEKPRFPKACNCPQREAPEERAIRLVREAEEQSRNLVINPQKGTIRTEPQSPKALFSFLNFFRKGH
jgi:hypothetical protein